MLKQRIITALVLLPPSILVALFGPLWLLGAVAAVLITGAAWEWGGLMGLKSGWGRMAYIALVLLMILLTAYFWRVPGVLFWILVAAFGWWIVSFFWMVALRWRLLPALSGLCGLLILVPAWLGLVAIRAHGNAGPQLLLFLLMLVWLADIGAYFAGRALGRHKLFPAVSPGKSWEGVGGGMLASAILAAIGSFWFGYRLPGFLLLCLFAVAFSIIGDLTVSLFKRQAGLKDTGSIFPGHGGVLDRIDSLTAAAPLFLLGLIMLERC